MEKKLNLILFLFLLLSFSVQAQQGTIHLFLVTQSGTTTGAEADAGLVKAEVEMIGQVTNQAVQIREYDRYDVSVLEDMQNLAAGPDDVIWFHYSGHGGNSGNGWPQYDARQGKVVSTSVHELLSNKSARLTITAFDSCNVGNTSTTWAARTLNVPGNQHVLLFKKAKGNILLSAASDSRFAYGDVNTGGFMTTSLIKALNSVTVGRSDTAYEVWERVLTMTKDAANEKCSNTGNREQEPKWVNTVSRDRVQIDVYDTPDEVDRNLPDLLGQKKKNN
ncbi:MAG: caspase family protein [Bacteroidota bacterium]